jgi:hypothetical protein
MFQQQLLLFYLAINIKKEIIPVNEKSAPKIKTEEWLTLSQSCPATTLATNPVSPIVVEYQPMPLALKRAGTKSAAIALPTALKMPWYNPYKQNNEPMTQRFLVNANPL